MALVGEKNMAESSKILVWSTWKSSPKTKKEVKMFSERCLRKLKRNYMESILGGGVFPEHGQQVATSK